MEGGSEGTTPGENARWDRAWAPRRGCERDGVAGPQTARAQGQEARVGMSAGPDHLGLVDLPLFNF